MSDERDEINNLRWAVEILSRPIGEGPGLSSIALIRAVALGEEEVGWRPFDQWDVAGNWRTYELLPAVWKPRAREIIKESERLVREEQARRA